MLTAFILDGDGWLASLSGHAIPEENGLVHTFLMVQGPIASHDMEYQESKIWLSSP
jgi:hypothetical protein